MFANFQHFLTELEINIKFPTCWDGVNVEDINGNHVTYSNDYAVLVIHIFRTEGLGMCLTW